MDSKKDFDGGVVNARANVTVNSEYGVISESAAFYLAEIIVQEFRKNKELQKAFEEWKKTPEAARYA